MPQPSLFSWVLSSLLPIIYQGSALWLFWSLVGNRMSSVSLIFHMVSVKSFHVLCNVIITTLIFFPFQSLPFPANPAWPRLKPAVSRKGEWGVAQSFHLDSAGIFLPPFLQPLVPQGVVSLIWMEHSSCLNLFLLRWGLSWLFWRHSLWALRSCSFLTDGLHTENYCKLPRHTHFKFCICDSDFFPRLPQTAREMNRDLQVASLMPHSCSKFKVCDIFHL